jgi:membrane protease YdiL (CAAX protease family)
MTRTPFAAAPSIRDRQEPLWTFFALACAITWLLAVPTSLSWLHHEEPAPWAIACAGLSAFGPLFALLAVAPRGERSRAFGPWRTHPGWVVLALAAPAAVHLTATALFAALGGQPTALLHPPATPEAMAALVIFPLGEEFGWRGFAYPRMVARFGAVRGPLLLGVMWGLWHLGYGITPERAGFDVLEFGLGLLELPLYSLLIGWVMEHARRSMAVALAFHAGAHLDHIERARDAGLALHACHLAVLAILAVLAARALAKRGLVYGVERVYPSGSHDVSR